jgi:hypothetical protein
MFFSLFSLTKENPAVAGLNHQMKAGKPCKNVRFSAQSIMQLATCKKNRIRISLDIPVKRKQKAAQQGFL